MNPGMMMYLLSQGDERSYDAESREDWGNRRQPDQHTGNGIHGDWPEGPEMRRRRDSKGRYMMEDDGMPDDAEMRRRGRDGRYMADGYGMPEDARSYDARNEYRPQPREYGRAESRYMPEYPIVQEPRGGLYDGGGIGFGTREHQYETRSHYGEQGESPQRQTARVGGTMWMEPEGAETGGEMEITRDLAERWVSGMKNEDKSAPAGGKWTPDMLKPMAQKYGIPTEGKRFWEFYAMTNAMYSDYGEVARKHGINTPDFYACLAKAWMNDKDANPNKTALYYKYIVKKE